LLSAVCMHVKHYFRFNNPRSPSSIWIVNFVQGWWRPIRLQFVNLSMLMTLSPSELRRSVRRAQHYKCVMRVWGWRAMRVLWRTAEAPLLPECHVAQRQDALLLSAALFQVLWRRRNADRAIQSITELTPDTVCRPASTDRDAEFRSVCAAADFVIYAMAASGHCWHTADLDRRNRSLITASQRASMGRIWQLLGTRGW